MNPKDFKYPKGRSPFLKVQPRVLDNSGGSEHPSGLYDEPMIIQHEMPLDGKKIGKPQPQCGQVAELQPKKK